MKLVNSVTALFLLAASGVLAGACSITTNNTNPTPDGGLADAGPATSDAAAGALSFTPSNVDLTGMDLSKVDDIVVSGANCDIYSESQQWGCVDDTKVAHKIVTLADASRLSIFVVKSLRIEASAVIKTYEHIPVVIVALDKMTLAGSILVQPGTAGGAFNTLAEQPGVGPGGGGTGLHDSAGGGGSFCGVGGQGAVESGSPSTNKGAYGKPELVPLLAGSSGGSGDVGNGTGSGGGAIQLVAGNSIEILAGAYINAGGNGGSFGGTNHQEASGGGSGGAILIEAPTVKVAGTLAANGGGGGQGTGDSGEDGKADDAAAQGGHKTTGHSTGGSGSAGDAADGANGQIEATYAAAGGGGGGGRIRINTTSGQADLVAAKLSPSSKTSCVSQGALKK